MSRHDDYKAELREAARAIWAAHHTLKALKAEADAGAYATTLQTEANEPPTADLLAVAYATNDAIATLFADGHATNIVKVL